MDLQSFAFFFFVCFFLSDVLWLISPIFLVQRANFEGNTFDCPLPSCCGEPGIHCGGQCIPPPTPTPSPSPPTPPIPPTPSPTPSHSCTMSLSSSPGGVPGPFAVFASTQHCGAGRFEWTYTETSFSLFFFFLNE